MALESGDLQHRRTSAAAKSTTTSRPTRTRSAASSVRRRKRGGERKSGAAARIVATVLVLAIGIPLLSAARRLLGSGGSSSNGNGARSLRDWKPKKRTASANAHIPSVEELEAEQRAKLREARYQSLYRPKFDESDLGYDIYNCPSSPPPGYPKQWKTTEVLRNWNPKDVTTLLPARRDVYQGLCVFDYQTQYRTALNYRKAEKPFVIRNDPKVTSVANRWEDDTEYLHRVFGDAEHFRTERSPERLFVWYRLRGRHPNTPEGYVRPSNDETDMTYGEWLERALEKDGRALGDEDMLAKSNVLKERRLSLMTGKRVSEEDDHHDDPLGGDDERGGRKTEDTEESKRKKYFYFRLNADLKSAREASPSKFIYDELSFFDPRKRRDSEFYIVDPNQERGINCRFGMRGVTAAAHFDMSRNMIAVFGGERRYILSSPSQCKHMALYPKGHPSVRHSSLDWSDPAEWDEHPEFKKGTINEVVLHAGDVLYLPTNWFHYIVNLSLNYQCNARSGTTHETAHLIEDCGFDFHH